MKLSITGFKLILVPVRQEQSAEHITYNIIDASNMLYAWWAELFESKVFQALYD